MSWRACGVGDRTLSSPSIEGIWPSIMTRAAAEMNPESMGVEMKFRRKPSLKRPNAREIMPTLKARADAMTCGA